jgi:general secretion pathway protein D
VIVEMTPRVTYEGEIVMDLVLENSARGQDSNIAGQILPAFASRKVTTRLRLRDGESNLLAGLLREDERRSLRGFPGILRLPLLQQLFADNDTNIRQTDIVMLLTPRIVRSHQLTTQDLSPIYIGTQANMAVGGPPPIFGGGADAAAPPAVAPVPPAPVPPAQVPPGTPIPVPGVGAPQIPPGSSPIPGTTTSLFGIPIPQPAPAPSGITSFPSPDTPAPPPAAPAAPAVPEPAPPAPTGAAAPPPPAGNPLTTVPPPAPAIVRVSPPGTELRVGGGPYLVPISITGASRLSTVSLSLTFNPAVLSVRTVQEGTLMRQGGVQATFTQKVDAAGGRVDIAIVRSSDVLGASGTGLVAAIQFDAVAPGTSPLAVSGVGTLAGAGAAPLQFQAVTVTVK